MIASVCGELACHVRHIIDKFVERFEHTLSSSSNQKLPVVITGGDGKFITDFILSSDASKTVPFEAHTSPIPSKIHVRNVIHLVHYAVGYLIDQKCAEKPMTPEEKLLQKIQSLRVAYPSSNVKIGEFTRGCIYKITTNSIIDGYKFFTRFDDGHRKTLTLRQLYDGLLLYNEIGEKKENLDAADEIWVSEKKTLSRNVLEELTNRSRSVKDRMRELDPYVQKQELHKVLMIPIKTRKRGRSEKIPDPNAHLGKRFAKNFPLEDASIAEESADTIFFGTVKHISDPERLWFFIDYDDGDSEEIGLEELLDGLQLYKLYKHHDSLSNRNCAHSPSECSKKKKGEDL